MPSDDDDTELDPALSTQEIIEAARRPVLIARHQTVVEEMETSIVEGFVDGTSQHPRLTSILQELDAESEQQRISTTINTLVQDPHCAGKSLREALIELLCLLREKHHIDVAALQLHLIGVYRRLRQMILDHQRFKTSVDDLRAIPTHHLSRLLEHREPVFGSARLAESLVLPEYRLEHYQNVARRIIRPANADQVWQDSNPRAMALSRPVEEPLLALPEDQRAAARERLVINKIRSRFYRAVFLNYLSVDNLSPEEIAAHDTILAWIQAIEATPHLYPFMQGQTASQKLWRLSCLFRKILQLNEIYQRVERAADHPSYRERMQDLPFRSRLSIVAKEHYPSIRIDAHFLMTTLLCPFERFAVWIQEQHGRSDFILPPDGKE